MSVELHDLSVLRSRAKGLATRALRKKYGELAKACWFFRREELILEQSEIPRMKQLAYSVTYQALLYGDHPHRNNICVLVDIDLITGKGKHSPVMKDRR